MSKELHDFSGTDVGLEAENALLRASLAEARQRICELEAQAEPTERRFQRELERVVGQTERHGTAAAVLYIDVTGLDAINIRHGRPAGDAALAHVSEIISKLIRSTDVFTRIGERGVFGLILDHLDHNSAIDTADRLARCIERDPFCFGGTTIALKAVIATTGIMPGDTPPDVMERVERNLLRIKSDY